MHLKLNQQLFDLSSPLIMGIINITPDSFYKGSRFTTGKAILHAVDEILENGGSIIDIGGFSTRPSAEIISEEEEIDRLSKALEIILKKYPQTVISIDTFRAKVARYIVENFQVAMINDVSGGTLDDQMFETIADLKVAYVLMHMRGTPQTMQQLTDYEDVVTEVFQFLQKRLAQLRSLGVTDVIIDPGFGFAKTIQQNYQLLKKLSYFKELGAPILAGLSRKSMIYKLLNITPDEALTGTIAVNMLALIGGASILRVHDVKEAVQTIKIFNEYIAAL
ncbi:MAG TPA: dihydropteroate synthase [Paludibacteraceae bacterium]|nr:dihydropteroate synthase [Paludibacteraceae bacterium]HOL00060.1 dihydropteroate synthase [Paludibacteraceae bacterium]HPO66987.1 dihydropteroate synthase [Paludibacteraceae bacterium]HRR62219.1 dihydropteroate synthase [Paludibacteraceae bacterium]